MRLAGLDGNAFNLLGHFERQARPRRTDDEVREVFGEATGDDYRHLLAAPAKHVEAPGETDKAADGTETENGRTVRRG